MASESEVEAGSIAAHREAYKHADNVPELGLENPAIREAWKLIASSALEAAERVRGEDDHVVLINKSSTDMAVCRLDCNGEPYGPGIIIRHGRELVIRKAVR